MKRGRKKIQNLKQIDGKNYNEQALTIDEVLGEKKDKFSTNNKEEYKKYLRGLNKMDLQRECISMGEMPHNSRDIMESRLFRAFNINIAHQKMRKAKPIVLKPKDPDAVHDALSGGANSLV